VDFSIAEREVKEAEDVKEVKDVTPTPPVFLSKSVQVAEKKGRTHEKKLQER
jgi:hypothetical protein